MFECPARPAGEGRGRAGVTGSAVAAIGRDVARIGCGTDRALCTLAGERPVVAGVASAGADRRVTRHAHRIGREVRCRIGVAVAALNSRHRNVRRRLQTSRGGAVMATRTIGIGGRMGEFSTGPAGKGRGRAGVTGDAISAIGWDVARKGCGADCTRRTLAGERTVVAGVAPAGADRRMAWNAHRVGDKARCRIGVAIAALNARHRNVRRRLQTSRGGAVMATRTIGIGGRMGEFSTGPAGKGGGRAGVTGDAVRAIGGDVTGERRRTLRALGPLTGE
jgi:hypothetical protein